VGIARGEQSAFGEYRQEELCALAQLLDIEVAAVFSRRERAQAG
jgi:hypothetical protein